MKVIINPTKLHDASIHIPSSKSQSHRALITAALADGESKLLNVVKNNDTEATISCMEKLGASFETKENSLIVHGLKDFSKYDGSMIDCGESGSTLRFLIPIFSLTKKKVIFTGHGRLMERPQTVYENLWNRQGLEFEKKENQLILQGALKPGSMSVRGDISSQFISGLLFALPLLNENSTLNIIPPYESKSYTGLTVSALQRAGIQLVENHLSFEIPGRQKYQPFQGSIEGDDSQAVFFAALSLLSGISIEANGLAHDSRQGDHAFLKDTEKMGLTIREVKDGYRFEGGDPVSSTIDLSDTPDLGPALFALASLCKGTTVFEHCDRLRIKESDRIACMEEELTKLGLKMQSNGGTVMIQGCSNLKGGVTLQSHNDHRIAMALATLACIAKEPIIIEGAEAVNKSYPAFFEDLKKTGAEIEYVK